MAFRSWLRLAAYAAALIAVLAAGLVIGRATMPHRPQAAAAAQTPTAPVAFGAVTMAAAGYTLSVDDTTLSAGKPTTLRLHVTGPDGQPVLRYGVDAGRLMRLALVRRDLTGYQTLAPSLSADGTWTAAATVADAGSWRLLADFTVLEVDGHAVPLLLGLDLSAAGAYAPQPPPSSTPDSSVDGYSVALAGIPQTGNPEPLLLTVRRDGQPAADLTAARLSILREGDLAYASLAPDPDTALGVLRFWLNIPSPARYRLFLDFTAGGAAHTAAFTLPTP